MRALILVLTFPALVAADLPAVDAVKIEKLFEVPNYCEGIVFDHEGFGYISHGRVITKFDPKTAKHTTWTVTGSPNGHKVLKDGTHLVCDASHNAVLRLDAKGNILGKASAACDGKPLRGPNDLSLDPIGGFYFTDPGGSDDKKPIGTVHFVDPKGKTHLLADGLAFPNGIVLTPKRDLLYVAESKQNRVLVWDVVGHGKIKNKRVFCELPIRDGDQIDNQPDGMCLDSEGNLYVAHYGMKQVQVIDPQGKIIRRYPGGNLTTSNVGFGGKEMNELYITGGLGKEAGGGGLFRIRLEGVRGLVILPKKE